MLRKYQFIQKLLYNHQLQSANHECKGTKKQLVTELVEVYQLFIKNLLCQLFDLRKSEIL